MERNAEILPEVFLARAGKATVCYVALYVEVCYLRFQIKFIVKVLSAFFLLQISVIPCPPSGFKLWC